MIPHLTVTALRLRSALLAKASVCAPDTTTVTALRLRSAVPPFAAPKAGKRVGEETCLKCVTLFFFTRLY